MSAKQAVFRTPPWLSLLFALVPLPLLYPHASWPVYIIVPVSVFLLFRWVTSIRITDREVVGPCADYAFLWRRRIPLEKASLVPPPDHAYFKYALGTTDSTRKITASYLVKKDQERLLHALDLDVSAAALE